MNGIRCININIWTPLKKVITMNLTSYFKSVMTAAFGLLLLSGCSSGQDAFSPQPSVLFTLGSGSGTSYQEGTLTLTPTQVSTNGTVDISVNIVNSTNNLVTSSTTVTFSSTCATNSLASFSPASVTTSSGTASTTYTNQGCTSADTVTASAVNTDGSDVTATGTISYSTTALVTVRIGSGTGVGFQDGVLTVASPSISAGGSTSVSANIVDANGNLDTNSHTVTFSSPCVTTADSSFSNASVTTSSGTAQTTYTSQSCIGGDVITASTVSSTGTVTATGTVTVAAPSAGTISYISSTDTQIALQNTGTASLPETSTLTFRVLDNSGSPLQNETVNFTLSSSLGGVSLASAADTSDINGDVTAVVQSGTVPGTVRVTATVASNTSLTTQSPTISISTGPPDQDSMSIAVGTFNSDSWDYDGVTVPITVYLADRFNNPIQDGTSISFITELGSIASSCTTSGGNGSCTVNWQSQNPRGTTGAAGNAGRTTIIATVEGEESFIDNNSNGYFDDGDTFTDQAEAFNDNNENGTYDSGEFFVDINNNSIFDGVPDGLYNGPGCQHSTLCSTNTSTSVRASTVLIMSESSAVSVSPAHDPVDVSAGSVSRTYTIVGGINGQVLPANTVVSFSVTNGRIVGQSSYTIMSTNLDERTAISGRTGIFEFPVTLATDNTSSPAGNFVLTISVPGRTAITAYTTIVD